MIKMKLSGFLIGFLAFSGMLQANEDTFFTEEPDLNSIEYIEEEDDIDLGFNTSDYLPENFDPYTFYMDLRAIKYAKEEVLDFNPVTNLPVNFNPYAYPKNFMDISYMDPSEDVEPYGKGENICRGYSTYIFK